MAWNFEMVQILNQCLYINALLLPLAFKLEVHQGQASYTYDRMSSAHTKTKVRNLFCRTDTLREHYEKTTSTSTSRSYIKKKTTCTRRLLGA